jgi:hypothetical protein
LSSWIPFPGNAPTLLRSDLRENLLISCGGSIPDQLKLPTHTSIVRYAANHFEAIHARATALYVVEANSRTANTKIKRERAEERETKTRSVEILFNFEGNSKHLILQFTATVKNVNGDLFLFKGPGIGRELLFLGSENRTRRSAIGSHFVAIG